ncbi:tRNA (adenine(22)-N(1))-methyltransferase [Streptococcus dentapri]|uniref:tRNA (Adenine(22)-N(1))-methyltransferase n=1 Tax=Streptococcus dentapri TaxID=573564 RepID=A0ABV8D1X2_9STRE
METNISKRLLDVADYIPYGVKLLDVGSDHAYLPIFLVEQDLITSAIAGEVAKGPYNSALTNVTESGLSDSVEVRLADGLAAFEPEDGIGAISVCGMGGYLITEILTAGLDKLTAGQRLILQPNNREDDVRSWLSANGFAIIAEKVMIENHKFYEIIVAEAGEQKLTAAEVRFGPCLLRGKSETFLRKWQRELAKLEVALTQVPSANQADRKALVQRIDAIKEAISYES